MWALAGSGIGAADAGGSARCTRRGPLGGGGAEDEESVRALSAHGARESFGERVRPGCADGVLMARMPSALKTASKEAVNLVSRSRIKNFRWRRRSQSPKQKFLACRVTHARGVGGDTGEMDGAGVRRDEQQDIEPGGGAPFRR